jgi:hypothetical protein
MDDDQASFFFKKNMADIISGIVEGSEKLHMYCADWNAKYPYFQRQTLRDDLSRFPPNTEIDKYLCSEPQFVNLFKGPRNQFLIS